jgi:hypothetical protein
MPPIGPSFSGSPYGSTAAAHQQSVDPSTVTGPPGLAESPFPAPVAALEAPPFHDERQVNESRGVVEIPCRCGHLLALSMWQNYLCRSRSSILKRVR